jgi:hypothetical protein
MAERLIKLILSAAKDQLFRLVRVTAYVKFS